MAMLRPVSWLGLLALSAVRASPQGWASPNNNFDYADFATSLNKDLLSNYDIHVPPKSHRNLTGEELHLYATKDRQRRRSVASRI